MEERILDRLERLGTPPTALWLWTLLTVQEVGRYPLEQWNEALSAALGHRIVCPSYRSLERCLREAVHLGGSSIHFRQDA